MSLDLQHVTSHLVRTLCAGLGLTFLYMAMFMYADERGNQQNRLVSLWIKVKQKEETSLDTRAAVIKYSSEIAAFGLDRFLGKRLFSIWTLSVSASLSVASELFVLVAIGHTGAPGLACSFGLALLTYGLFVAPSLFRKQEFLYSLLAVVLLIILLSSLLRYEIFFANPPWDRVSEVGDWWDLFSFVSTAIVFGALCDMLLIAVNRLLVKAMAESASRAFLYLGILFNLLWTLAIADSLRIDARWFQLPLAERGIYWIFGHLGMSRMTDVAISSNWFTLVASSSALVVTGAAVVTPLLWPMLGRIVNALYEWEIFTNKKLQLSAGISFLTLAFVPMGTLLKAILEHLGIAQ
jgi:hypothetical protein